MYSDRKQISSRLAEGSLGRNHRSARKLSGVTDMFAAMIVVMVLTGEYIRENLKIYS